MEKQTFWGIDISKQTLDISISSDTEQLCTVQIPNTPTQVSKAVSLLMKKHQLQWKDCVFCMENTGVYTTHLLQYLCAHTQQVYVVNPLHLKQSMGLTRGKNDKVDAQRIARFIARNYRELHVYRQP